jgi:hypothetical protein
MTDDRAERALRTALEGLDLPPSPAPDALRHRARTRRATTLAMSTVAALAAVVLGILVAPGLLPLRGGGPVAVPAAAPVDPAPSGWRTEYYRNVAFQVPDSWGYAYEPGSDWCTASPDGKPTEQHRRPYVSLGQQPILAAILCPAMPPSLRTEHVLAQVYEPVMKPKDEARQDDGWWIVQRVLGPVVVIATSQDRERATRIVTSASVAADTAPCPATSAVQRALGQRPKPAVDITTLDRLDYLTLCQYDIDDPDHGYSGGLRAARTLSGASADRLLQTLAEAPPTQPGSCDPAPRAAEIGLLLRLAAGGDTSEVYVQAAGCPAGEGADGGIDDGTAVRTLTRPACQALLTPPMQLSVGSGDIGRNCLG